MWLFSALSSHAQENGGFELLDAASGLPTAWAALGGDAGEVTSDAETYAFGRRSLRVANASVTRIVQRVAVGGVAGSAGRRVRLSGYVRAASGAEAEPALWLRIDGASGLLFLDSRGAGAEDLADAVAGAPSAGWRRHAVELPLPGDVREVVFGGIVRGVGTAWFDELELQFVATHEGGEPAPKVVAYLDSALVLMRTHAITAADVDWTSLRERTLVYARGAQTSVAAHLALRFAIRELRDGHSYLQAPAAVRELEERSVSNALTRAPPVAAEGRRVGERVGYVVVPGVAGGTHRDQVGFAERLNKIIQEIDLEGVCGWIVDLRQNRGGNLWPMLVGLGPLFDEGELATSLYPDGRRVSVWYRDGQGGLGDYVQLRVPEPYRPSLHRPVAVLQGPATASAAEVLVLAFRARAATRAFGAPTGGASSGTRVFPLQDGAALVLAVAATADAAGHRALGPLQPDEVISSESERDAGLGAALAWLEGTHSCR